jgi:hypothetical protein
MAFESQVIAFGNADLYESSIIATSVKDQARAMHGRLPCRLFTQSEDARAIKDF